MSHIEHRTPEQGEYFLCEEEDDGLLTVIFIGLWASLTDAFISIGIIKSKEARGTDVVIAAHENDERYLEGK